MKILTTSMILTLTLSSFRTSHGMQKETNINDFPKFVLTDCILKPVIIESWEKNQQNDTLINLRLVCKKWKSSIDSHIESFQQTWLEKNYDIKDEEGKKRLRQFLKGKLIYTDPKSKKKISYKISNLPNPLEGEINLGPCGDAVEYLTVLTGYRKKKTDKNAEKVEIWLTLWDLVNHDIPTSAIHLKPIFNQWKKETAPIGIFWTWGGWSNLTWCNHLTTVPYHELSKKNFYKNWLASISYGSLYSRDFLRDLFFISPHNSTFFQVHFVN